LINTEPCLIDDFLVIGPKKSGFLGFVICLAIQKENVTHMAGIEALANAFLFALSV